MLAYWQAILDEAGTHAIGAQDVLEMYRPSNYDAHAAAAFVAADGDFTVRCAQRRIADLLVPAGVRVFEYVPPIATAPLRAPARTRMAYTHAHGLHACSSAHTPPIASAKLDGRSSESVRVASPTAGTCTRTRVQRGATNLCNANWSHRATYIGRHTVPSCASSSGRATRRGATACNVQNNTSQDARCGVWQQCHGNMQYAMCNKRHTDSDAR